jgi:Flp pilus assembly pilin Flp
MERIKRFLLDDSATAEATSTVVMIAAVGILLAAGLITWYGQLDSFFSTAGSNLSGAASQFALPAAS